MITQRERDPGLCVARTLPTCVFLLHWSLHTDFSWLLIAGDLGPTKVAGGMIPHVPQCGTCPHCGQKYSNQSALKYHVRLMHSDMTNTLCCHLCPRSFAMRDVYKTHMWEKHKQRCWTWHGCEIGMFFFCKLKSILGGKFWWFYVTQPLTLWTEVLEMSLVCFAGVQPKTHSASLWLTDQWQK